MDCENCGEKATVHFTQLVDGQMKKMSLCEACAEKKGILDLDGFGLADAVMGPSALSPASGQQDTCPVCGFTRQKFQQVGRLGCSHCYQIFPDELDSRLPNMHRGVIHKGRMPVGARGGELLQARLMRLKGELEEMIGKEKFEEAARLRDEILELEKEEELAK
ncbi:MAG: UvrB/UvrC motif-containing protein [Verrucomicrobiota bacterium JB023]|nr:UvrB/UvrC motif-containing protein [Verrucomicrobiota bacterium JB023]